MKTVGVISEYNPFHTGHAWQLAELRRRLGGETAVVCAMSGNFVQRGDFAVLRKHVRAEAAVRCGADLVLELPLPWAISSAEGFAQGGVEVLDATGVVDRLAFGSERADTALSMRAAEALLSPSFAPALRRKLEKGGSFASARQEALEELLGADAAATLSQPNDILGVEYCKALRRTGSAIAPMALPRVGAGHDDGAADGYASASYIREHLASDGKRFLTPEMAELYEREEKAGRAPVRVETVERAMLVKLRMMTEADFAAYDEGGEGLYHRFYEASRTAASLEGLLESVKTKRYAYARLRRMALAMYLDAKPSDRPEHVPYLRVLAMNHKGRYLLHEMRASAKLPVLIKPADAHRLSAASRRLMDRESRAADLYALSYPDLAQSAGGSEWRTTPVIVEEEQE